MKSDTTQSLLTKRDPKRQPRVVKACQLSALSTDQPTARVRPHRGLADHSLIRGARGDPVDGRAWPSETIARIRPVAIQ